MANLMGFSRTLQKHCPIDHRRQPGRPRAPEIGGRATNPITKARVAWLNPLSFDKLFRAVTNIVGRVL
jgi:hypothetical protein